MNYAFILKQMSCRSGYIGLGVSATSKRIQSIIVLGAQRSAQQSSHWWKRLICFLKKIDNGISYKANMYRGFNVEIFRYIKSENEELYEQGRKLFAKHKAVVKNELRSLILEDGSLDGSEMQKQWFPNVEADVFISHSHVNEETAFILAGYLYNRFGLESFIDSAVWGYSAELLKELDNKFCANDNRASYDYNLRNLSTSHVYLMLSGALSKMIDSTECLFFLNTPDSVKPSKVIDAEATLSPWIYSEILTTKYIRKREPNEHARRQRLTKGFSGVPLNESIRERFTVTHKLELGHLTKIDEDIFDLWYRKSRKKDFTLDVLYKMYPEDDALVNS